MRLKIRRSAHQGDTEKYEWFHLVRSYSRRMMYDGVEALDDHVVGRCHVAKGLHLVSRDSIPDRRKALHGRGIKHIGEFTGWHVYRVLAHKDTEGSKSYLEEDMEQALYDLLFPNWTFKVLSNL